MSYEKSKRQNNGSYRYDDHIRSNLVRVIFENQNYGVMPRSAGVAFARSKNLNLVEITEGDKSKPSVCLVVDYGKFVFEQKKKQKQIQRNKSAVETKEVRFTPSTDKGDIDRKIKKINEFLEEGKQVKITVKFGGRELAHIEEGNKIIDYIVESTQALGKLQYRSKLEHKNLSAIIVPKTDK